MSTKIVVVGAGVIGLTTAWVLSQNEDFEVTVVAKHMPGDYDIEYASPWAGANSLPYGEKGSLEARWEEATFHYLFKTATTIPAAGMHLQDVIAWRRDKDLQSATGQWVKSMMNPDPWFKDTVSNFHILQPEQLPEGVDGGTGFGSVCINTAIYLPYLASQCLANGVTIKRGILKHILDAKTLHSSGQPPSIIINCTALGAATLGGVLDKAVHPIRGQTVLVRNEADAMYDISGTDDGPDEIMYIMTRAAGGGTILGGSFQAHNTNPIPDPDLADRIMKRAVKACPALADSVEGLDVVRHNVGLRPARTGGPRLEAELVKDGDRENWVVHCYGHAGFGYQSSYGAAMDVFELVKQTLTKITA